ncbi:hypothetical protein SAHY_03498 [Salinisphaera hydrothermalis EPR70]
MRMPRPAFGRPGRTRYHGALIRRPNADAMPAIRQSNLVTWICEGAGLAGMAATLVACALAYNDTSQLGFWSAVAVAFAANLIYITHVFARRATGNSALTWRELILATLVPTVALIVTVVITGQVGGWFQLPFAGAANGPEKHVITISPKQG